MGFQPGKKMPNLFGLKFWLSGIGGGSVGRAVASDTRDPWFESRLWQNFIYQLHNLKKKIVSGLTQEFGPNKNLRN